MPENERRRQQQVRKALVKLLDVYIMEDWRIVFIVALYVCLCMYVVPFYYSHNGQLGTLKLWHTIPYMNIYKKKNIKKNDFLIFLQS